MPMTTSELNSIATKYGTDAVYISLHTADPGNTGANEVTGGAPAYARKAITWSAPTNGVITGSVTFDVPSGTTVAYIGVWDLVTAGTFKDKAAVTSQAFSSQGQYQINATATVTG